MGDQAIALDEGRPQPWELTASLGFPVDVLISHRPFEVKYESQRPSGDQLTLSAPTGRSDAPIRPLLLSGTGAPPFTETANSEGLFIGVLS